MSGNVRGLASFQDRLRWALDQDPRSRGEIAAEAEISQSRFSEWTATGERAKEPNLESLRVIASALPGVSMDWLLTGRGEPFTGGDAEETLAAIRELLDRRQRDATPATEDDADDEGGGPVPGGPMDRTG